MEAELRRMPFVVETPSLIRQKTALEDRLKVRERYASLREQVALRPCLAHVS